ncbi:MAG: rhodanese-like domain-containing protein [Marinobacter sp.]|uniref:rhodanese-like domain-containing protein n=1 Tax=Marinobacter sp. TaxID=50741 RepID=UPI00299D7D6F|nr:rhodanese-like domain-containing protein [Marinobacter sp.]MDX1633302.1 rhodanese-like domain-containing protein [Marinobacter sp.]
MLRHLIAVALIVAPFSLPAEPGRSVTGQSQQSDAALFSDQGYRIDRYRSPTPATVAGATTVSTADLERLMDQHPDLVIIDVINLEYRHGRFLEDKPHLAVPGAHWLPNTGRGQLDEPWLSYLLDNVQALTEGNRDRPVAVLCKSDCWLSWNATRRLADHGYRQLFWYKDGIDSWQNAGMPTEPAQPVMPRFDINPTASEG